MGFDPDRSIATRSTGVIVTGTAVGTAAATTRSTGAEDRPFRRGQSRIRRSCHRSRHEASTGSSCGDGRTAAAQGPGLAELVDTFCFCCRPVDHITGAVVGNTIRTPVVLRRAKVPKPRDLASPLVAPPWSVSVPQHANIVRAMTGQ